MMHKRTCRILVIGVDKTEWLRLLLFILLPDCPSCPSTKPTTEANTYTTPQTTAISTKTEGITTTLATSSAYTDPADQKSGLCLDNQGILIDTSVTLGW